MATGGNVGGQEVFGLWDRKTDLKSPLIIPQKPWYSHLQNTIPPFAFLRGNKHQIK